MSYYVHDVPGRLRVKNPLMKGKEAVAQEMTEFLRAIPGIHSVSANPLTGSTVVHYDAAALDSKQILSALGQGGHFDPSRTVTFKEYTQQRFSKVGQVIGKALLGVFIEKAFEGTPLVFLSAML